LREGVAPPAGAAGSSAPSAAPATVSVPGREFKETRLQIRLASGGQPMTTTLPSDASCVFLSFVSILERTLMVVVLANSAARGGGICCWPDFVRRRRHGHIHPAVSSVCCLCLRCSLRRPLKISLGRNFPRQIFPGPFVIWG